MDRWLAALVWVVVFAVLIGLLGLYARGVVDLGLTSRFRAAEAISNGRTPAQWVAAIDRHLALRRALTPLTSATRAAAHVAGVSVLDAAVLGAGRLELRAYLREQAVSRVVHRYGTVMEPAKGSWPPA